MRALATRLIVALLAFAVLASPAFAVEDQRIVAVGDVHGSYDSLTAILGAAGLIDDDEGWSGGTATLVQTGDLLDRGLHMREVVDLIIDLEEEAAAAGGRVVALLGNHEVNNLVGYFSTEEGARAAYAALATSFADDRSEKRRKRALRRWRAWQRRYPSCAPSSREKWLDRNPPGWLEYLEAIGPEGRWGAWLRRRDVAARIGDTIFVHGGLAPEVPEPWDASTLEAINRQVALELERFDADRAILVERGISLPFSPLEETYCALMLEIAALELREDPAAAARRSELGEIRDRLPTADNWLAFSAAGPLWFRGYARWTEEEGAAEIERLAARYDAERFVVGHTPQTEGIRSRFGGRVFLIDTAMVFGAAAGGRPAALEISGGTARPLYATADDSAAPAAAAAAEEGPTSTGNVWLGPDDEPLPFESDEEILDFLRSAEVVSKSTIPVGVTEPQRLMLERDGVRSKAAFRTVDIVDTRRRLSDGTYAMYFRDHYINEVAAYELGRLLGMDNIPPAVERRIGRDRGSVQIWRENTMMEIERRQKGLEPPDRTRFNRHFWEMRVFDNLINNIDRNQGNILIESDGKVWLIDHTRSFARSKALPAPKDVIACSRGFWERLNELDEEAITERLSPYLGEPEIRAVLLRREKLLRLVRERIAEQGEKTVLFEWGEPDGGVTVTYVEEGLPPGD